MKLKSNEFWISNFFHLYEIKLYFIQDHYRFEFLPIANIILHNNICFVD